MKFRRQVDFQWVAEQETPEGVEWCFQKGTRPTEEQIQVWNAYMSKRGWRDDLSDRLASRKKEGGLENRDDIQTMFNYIDADEGR